MYDSLLPATLHQFFGRHLLLTNERSAVLHCKFKMYKYHNFRLGVAPITQEIHIRLVPISPYGSAVSATRLTLDYIVYWMNSSFLGHEYNAIVELNKIKL